MHSGRTVLITGGSSGIGKETAKEFSKLGDKVVFCGRNPDKGAAAEKEIKNSRFIQCDIQNPAEIDSLFTIIREDYGSIDVAVNNAGISKSGKSIPEYSLQDFDEIVGINIRGLFLCLQKELECMAQKKRGSIINVASVLGVKGHRSKNALYTMTKHAVVGITKEAALEFAAEGIRVNAVLPAYTETEIIKHHLNDPEQKKRIAGIHPINRLIQPLEVANAIVFLAGEKASAMTGALVPVDGGCLAM